MWLPVQQGLQERGLLPGLVPPWWEPLGAKRYSFCVSVSRATLCSLIKSVPILHVNGFGLLGPRIPWLILRHSSYPSGVFGLYLHLPRGKGRCSP